MTEKMIEKLIENGARRWTKYGKDRLYFNATNVLNLEISYYNTGNVRTATLNGERISNSDARRYLDAKAYIDLTTDELHVSAKNEEIASTIEDAVNWLVNELEEAEEEEEEEEEETAETDDRRCRL